jgi:eukaryotic-like serine/threonine-protein kinase
MPEPTNISGPAPALAAPPETVTNVPANPGLVTTGTFAPGRVGPFADATAHARGALGEVLRATDTSLHRTVAVKRLLPHRAANLGSLRRFLLEAEVTARLEHPGVVPVYALYPDAEGGPAYAMRFVEGPTLAEAIATYHSGQPDSVAFRRLLRAFHQVCQTVAYAHSRGVIHRDLKPQNILLGRFGETLVADWGLAKVVGRPDDLRADPLAEGTLVPGAVGTGLDAQQTQMGSAVGTPAYMSPEQAAGRWNVVDQCSDVYGLGAVLYTVLTGKPPLERGDWPEMQQKIQRGDFLRPRQVRTDISRPLESVCLKAMAADPPTRYSSANDLAADVERWLADEPVTAYREPAGVRLARWGRRHKPTVAAAVSVLVAAVLALSVSTLLIGRAWDDTTQALIREKAAHRVTGDTARAASDANTRLSKAMADLKLVSDEIQYLSDRPDLDGDALYRLARIYSVMPEPALTDGDRAVEFLRKAQAKNFFRDAARLRELQQDPVFDRLRVRRDYQTWLGELRNRD